VKYLETKHERNSARITALIALIILLLLFVVGPQYMDPPEEYGVAVNFGTTDFGSGNKPLSEPRKAIEDKVVEESQPEETKVEPTEATAKAEDVLTQENAEAIAIKKQKEVEAKAKADAERIERQKKEADEKKRKEEEEKRRKLDNLIGGVKNAEGNTDGGEGPDNKGGNKGQLDGDPYAPSYFGGSGPGKGGVGYGLGGRGKPTNGKVFPECQETGIVVVEVRVNRQGRVVEAIPGKRGTTGTQCLFEAAKKTALTFKWPANSDAPLQQIGFVSINFDVGQ
jgi:colicin import membrane protein